jgi:hypothetical protein
MTWLVLAFGGVALAVLGQALILRLSARSNGMVAFVLAGVPVGLALMAALLPGYSTSQAWAGVFLYAFLCELWMFVFSSTFSSVSANLTLHLRAQPLRRSHIDQLYDNRAMIHRRIRWLHHIHAAVEKDGRLVPTDRGRKLAGLFDAVRTFFGHG